MSFRLNIRPPWRELLAGATWMALVVQAGGGLCQPHPRPPCPIPPGMPAPMPSLAPVQPARPGEEPRKEGTTPSQLAPQPTTQQDFSPEASAAAGGETFAAASNVGY